jgi:hypothetical protein
MSGRWKPKPSFPLDIQRFSAPVAAGICFRQIKIQLHQAWLKLSLFLCATVAILVLPALAWANSLRGDSVQAFFLWPSDQVQSLGIEPAFDRIDPADLSVTTEDYGDGAYDRFTDQIVTHHAPIGAVDPASDQMSWAVLVIAFAGMTAAASSWCPTRRAAISI